MELNPSRIQESAGQAWLLYDARRQLSPRLLRGHIYRAWERSHLLRASPRQPQAERLSAAETTQRLLQKADLLEAARPYLSALSTAAGLDRHAAMLGDEEAVVLDVLGDETTLRDPGFPSAGSILTEALSGANGIGTPLAEGAYAELVGTEHFIQGFHEFTCQGLPLRRLDGRLVGVLSTSVRRPAASERLREIFAVAARGIEAELALRQLERRIASVVAAEAGGEFPLENLRQDVVQSYAIARTSLELASLQWADESVDDGRFLLMSAGRAIENFRDLSSLCIDLVSTAQGAVESASVLQALDRIERLLATETRIRHVELLHGERVDIVVEVDRLMLERQLLRLLLNGIKAASGGILRIDVRQHETLAGGVRITASPLGLTNAHEAGASLSLSVPSLGRAGSREREWC